jgi:hypothetical protein
VSELNITLPWGDDNISLSLPEGWHLKGVLEPSPQPGVEDPVGEIRHSLEDPSGSPRLRDLVEEGMTVAVVIDELSRPTPVDLILAVVLEELRRGGARREEITLVTALGVHRSKEEEVAARVGAEQLGGLRLEEAIATARRRFPGRAEVLAFPHGGITYPILPAQEPEGKARSDGHLCQRAKPKGSGAVDADLSCSSRDEQVPITCSLTCVPLCAIMCVTMHDRVRR